MCASLPVQVITAAALLGVGEPIRLGSLSDTELMHNSDGSDDEDEDEDEDEDGVEGAGPPSSSQVRELNACRHSVHSRKISSLVLPSGCSIACCREPT
jgi:hypothetical protein